LCRIYTSLGETPPVSGSPPPHPPAKKRSRRPLYAALAVIAVVAVALAFMLVYLTTPSYRVNINSVPSGGGFITVDGNPVQTPYTASWLSGSTHNVTANSPANSESGVQYAYSSWSDGGAQSHTIVAKNSANYTASFVTLLPLTYNYTSGEEMDYNLSYNVTNLTISPVNQNVSETGTLALNIISFDGENYTINETLTIHILNQTFATSATYAMNKTGYITPVNSTAETSMMLSWFFDFNMMFQKSQAEPGDTWQVPFSTLMPNTPNATLNGNLNETFGDIQNLTVPAGTYRVFNLNLSGANLTMVSTIPYPINQSMFENFTLNGQTYLEYGTCRMIQTNLQMSITYSTGTQTSNETLTEQVELVKHINP
jgi:hypothetical protein